MFCAPAVQTPNATMRVQIQDTMQVFEASPKLPVENPHQAKFFLVYLQKMLGFILYSLCRNALDNIMIMLVIKH